MAKLGNNLSKTLQGLTDLLITMDEGPEKEKVRNEHKELSRQIGKLIDKNIDTKIKEYKEAIEAVNNANKSIKEAKGNIDRVAKVIDDVATVISAIAKLLIAL